MSVSVALLSRAPFAGTAFYLRICLSVHAFTDLHLGNTRFTPLFLFLYFTVFQFSLFVHFHCVKLTLCIVLYNTYLRSVFICQIFPKFSKVLLLLFYLPSMRVFYSTTFFISSKLPWLFLFFLFTSNNHFSLNLLMWIIAHFLNADPLFILPAEDVMCFVCYSLSYFSLDSRKHCNWECIFKLMLYTL